MANKYGIEVPPINDYFNNGDWTCKGKEIPIELQDRVNKLFNFIYEKYPDQVVIGLKKLSQAKHKYATDLMKELGFDDLKGFFSDFGFYYDYDGALAFRLYNEGVKVEIPEEEINIEPIGPAAIPLEDIYVNGTFKSIRDQELLNEDSSLNVFLNKILEKYPNRMIYKFSYKYRTLSEKMPGLRNEYVYEDNFSLFADFGFTYISNYSETNKYNWLEQHFKGTDLELYFKPFNGNDIPATELGGEFYIDDDLYEKLKKAMEPFNVDLDTYLEYKLLSVTVKFSFKANDLTDKLTNGKVLKPDFVRRISSNLNKNEIDNYNLYLLKRINKADDINDIKRIMSLYSYLNIEIDYRSLAVASLITYFSSFSDDYIGLFNYANSKTLADGDLRLDTELLEGSDFEITESDPSYYYLINLSRSLSEGELLEVENIYNQIKGYKDIDDVYKDTFGKKRDCVVKVAQVASEMPSEYFGVSKIDDDNSLLKVLDKHNVIDLEKLYVSEEFKSRAITGISEGVFTKGKHIRSLRLSKNVEFIEELTLINPISNLLNLENVEVDSENEFFRTDGDFLIELTPYGERILTYFGSDEVVYLPHVREVASYCFKNRRSVKKIVLNEDNIILDNYALAESDIEEVINSKFALKIGAYAFSDKLKEFKLSDNLEYIDDSALLGSNVLLSIDNSKYYFIYNNVLYVNKKNYYRPILILKNDNPIVIKDDVKELDFTLLNPCDGRSIVLPDGLEHIYGLNKDLTGKGNELIMSENVYNIIKRKMEIINALKSHFKIKVKNGKWGED